MMRYLTVVFGLLLLGNGVRHLLHREDISAALYIGGGLVVLAALFLSLRTRSSE